MYVANHYVRINGSMFVKGEVIPEIPKENIDWLLESGAIQKVALDSKKELGEVSEENDGEPITEELEEADETAEAPEINVMDGIVSEEKPAPKRRRKK